jgi:pimeloyl-ACP methyl ester carboxylesterase
MAFMVKDGFRLYYYEAPGGQAPAVLFLHGAAVPGSTKWKHACLAIGHAPGGELSAHHAGRMEQTSCVSNALYG